MDEQSRSLDSQSTETKRDPDLWFDDGNVIVVAQHCAFRFHKSVLSRHSEVFHNLFAIPQPPASLTAMDTMDDCPTVHVSDSSHDSRELLTAVYGGLNSYLHPDKVIEFSSLGALARLSHKYQLEGLLEVAVARLKGTFTTSFTIWAKMDRIKASPLNLVLGDAIEAVNLFRLLARTEMLPIAVYACCQLNPGTLVHGFKRADRTVETLRPTDLELCLKVQRELIRADFSVTRHFVDFAYSMTHDTCSDRPSCASIIGTFDRSYGVPFRG